MEPSEFTTARTIYSFLRRIHIRPVYYLAPLLLSLFAAVFEGVGMGLLIPLLNGFLTGDYSFVTEAPILSTVFEFLPDAITSRDRTLFIFLISTFVVAIILKNILKFSSFWILSYLNLRALHHLRKELFTRYLSFGKKFFDQSTIGHHATVLSEFVQLTFVPLYRANDMFGGVFSLLVYFVIMSLISWRLMLVSVPLFLVIHFAVRFIITRVRRHSHTLAAQSKELGKRVVEILSIIPLVHLSNMEKQEQTEFTQISNDQAHLRHRMNLYDEMIYPIQELTTLFGALLIFSITLYLLVLRGESTPSAYIVFFYLVLNTSNKLGRIAQFRSQLARASAPVIAINEIFEDDDKHIIPNGTKEFKGLQRGIEFRNLTFRYGGGVPALEEFSLKITKGKMTALVGASGAGKSTVAQLLARFYDIPPGTLFIDDTDIRDYRTASLRQHMSMVSQDTLLLNASMRHNITYGMGKVSDDRLQNILEQSRLSDFVSKLPGGVDTLVGDRGVRLSGGEKQRLAIARTLLRQPSILILDEATSALDSETEKLIQEAIDEVVQGRTSVVIAHRLSTIRHADSIVVLEAGRVIEQGTLDELMAKKGRFHDYWQRQMSTL